MTKMSAEYLFQYCVLARDLIHISNEEWNQVLNHFGQRDSLYQHSGEAKWLYQKRNGAIHRRSHLINLRSVYLFTRPLTMIYDSYDIEQYA